MFEPAHRLLHQFRRAAQIPLRIGDVNMAEIGGQDRQKPAWILIGLIPVYECIRRKCVPHVVQAWSVTIGCAAQSDLPR